MGILTFWKKDVADTADKGIENVRIKVEELLKKDFMPSEIAKELGINVERVYVIDTAMKRRIGRMIKAGSQDSTIETDPIREMNIEIKRLELEKRKQELEWSLEDRRADRARSLFGRTEPDEEEEPEDPMNPMIQALLMGFLTRSQTPPGSISPGGFPQIQQPQIQAPAKIDFTAEEIEQIINQNPGKAKILQKMPDDTIKKMIQGQIPNISDQSLDLAIAVLKKKEIKPEKELKGFI